MDTDARIGFLPGMILSAHLQANLLNLNRKHSRGSILTIKA